MYKIFIYLFFLTCPWLLQVEASPRQADLVLATVEVSPQQQHARELKLSLINEPDNQALRMQLVKSYMSLAKQTNDPRYWGMAEAVLKPIMHFDTEAVQMLKATILQFQHYFKEAEHILSQVIEQNPVNAQARLMRAGLFQVMGDYQTSLRECHALAMLTTAVITAACVLSAKGYIMNTVDAHHVINQMFKMLQRDFSLTQEQQAWLLGIMADVSVFHGKRKLSENFLKQAILKKTSSIVEKIQYADLLISNNQFQDVIKLLENDRRDFNSAIRLLFAEKQLHSPNYFRNKQSLENRIKTIRLRGDQAHYRELALYYCLIENDREKAFNFAKSNWERQKEYIDTALLLSLSKDLNNDIYDRVIRWAKSQGITSTQGFQLSWM